MHKGYLRIAAFLGGLSVLLGAFAAHGLKKYADDHVLSIFETGVRYQLYHVFALSLTAILFKEFRNKWIEWAGAFFILGTILFSGSLYLLTYISIWGMHGWSWVGPVTPIGGIFFIAGWVFMALGIKK